MAHSKPTPRQINTVLRRALESPNREQLLWLAVIQRTVEDLHRSDIEGRSARAFFLNRQTLESRCELSGLDPDFVLSCVLKLGPLQ